ncbi:uncharacterized protein isoform X1 [Macaca fascicularis]|uniref:uncharacterized protein isoform X1 n=1 Tax=Macaca fascicularis TaxID=9541 RepID=UPI001E2530D1|nr:uncharacterized protein LOC123572933 [Macaca fascicularis]
MPQKLRVRGKEGTRGLKKFRERGECAGVPAADPPPRTHSPASPGGASAAGRARGRGRTIPGKGGPPPRWLPNSWWLFQRRVSEGSTNATSEGPPTQKRRPAAGGWLSALKARFLPRWGGREREQTDPTSNSTNVQKGLGSRVYSSLQSMLFLIPVCLLQLHVLLSRSQPQHWHFLKASRSVLPHEGREGYDRGSRPPREDGLGEPSPAESAVGTCLLHRAW